MHFLIFLVPLLPLAFAFRRSPGWLFLWIYVPALLLVPDGFRTVTAGIPKLSVNQAIIMTILPFALFHAWKRWRLSVTDALVFAMVVLMAVSEYEAAGYSEAQNLAFGMIASALAPYLVARLVIGAENLDVALARRVVILLFAIVLVSTFEFRFGWNPFLVLPGYLFPGQGTGWVTTFRYGFARVAGPYSHAILAGMMIVIAYRLQRWLQWGGHWEERFARFPRLPWKKSTIITAVLLAGSVMTIARGPWIGGALGAIPPLLGRLRDRRRAMIVAGALALVFVPAGYFAFQSYTDVAPGLAMTTSQQTAVYRKELMEKYVGIALDHALLGWGRNTWPKVAGMSSIDNYFLLLSLMHGLLVTAAFGALFLWQGVRLFRLGMREPAASNSLAFTFVGILIAVFVSIVTVYLGEQLVPMFFVVLGWSEVILQRGSAPAAAAVSHSREPLPAHAFRVMR
jgi:hypothetical protein